MRRLVVAAIAGAVLADLVVAWWWRRGVLHRRAAFVARFPPAPMSDAELRRWMLAAAPPDPADWHVELRPANVELRMRA